MKKHFVQKFALLALAAALVTLGLSACKSSHDHSSGSEHPKTSEHPEHPR